MSNITVDFNYFQARSWPPRWYITDVKKTTMPEVIVKAIPHYKQFSRAAKLWLNPRYVEDLWWEIPEKLPALCPGTEVSEVTEVVPRAVSQDTTTTPGEFFMNTEPTSWFQSLTDWLKEELSQWVTSITIKTMSLCIDQPL